MPPDDAAPAPAGARPAPGTSAAPQPGTPPDPRDNPIPYNRVQQMLAAERARVQREFEQRARERSPEERLTVAKAILKAVGYDVPEEQPAPVTMDEVRQLLEERTSHLEQQYAIRDEVSRGLRELADAKAKYAEHFAAFPGIEQHLQKLWGADGTRSMAEIADEYVANLDKFVAARNQAYQQRKGADRRAAGVRPPGALGSGTPPQHDLSTPEGQDAALDELLGQEG